ncbi:MAG: hypothetical protein JXR94_18030 [Candidatus Hydrogenedentes bacterium]|nr:hypothetical protein [Candidatus Hydrogenedentota bacterium]
MRLLTAIDGEEQSHFRLCEFENGDGLAMVHASTLASLERVRRDLAAWARRDVWVIVTDALRTDADLERLAARLGWIDEGGAVSRDSKHLARHGGIAVDLVAVVAGTRERIPQRILGEICRRHFDWVKDSYRDGHVHADNRHRGREPAR